MNNHARSFLRRGTVTHDPSYGGVLSLSDLRHADVFLSPFRSLAVSMNMNR